MALDDFVDLPSNEDASPGRKRVQNMNNDGEISSKQDISKGDDENSIEKPLPKELSQMFCPLECKLCNVSVSSPMNALTHYKGKLHLKQVNKYLAKNDEYVPSIKKPKTSFKSVCEICSVKLTSEMQAQQHFSGKSHLKNIRRPKGENFIVVPKLETLTNTNSQPTESEFACTLCCVTTTSADQLEAHKKGSKHLKKLKKEFSAENVTAKDLSMYRTPSDLYYCPKCNLSTNSADQFLQHTESKKHKKNIKIKEILKTEAN